MTICQQIKNLFAFLEPVTKKAKQSEDSDVPESGISWGISKLKNGAFLVVLEISAYY